ncbi:YqiA/YcfP family alpha/beta fold hydrolase [Litorivivens sp.]|uniref:YqiA/YcfP family alpha/beta fold hydrolase n=1 Tax=Litorivivens sp. TaxID=2020868 RepID=UPI00356287FB
MAAAVLYIHGFISSPQSIKAQQTGAFMAALEPAVSCRVPALPNTPQATLDTVEYELQALLASHERVGLIGSSLGGFFATVLAEKYALPAVLINPAVRPHNLIRHYIGENHNPYTDEYFQITLGHTEELARMEPSSLTPERYWVLLQEGDETLDYRNAQSYYSACRMTVEPGGDHSFTTYEQYLPDIAVFLNLTEQ